MQITKRSLKGKGPRNTESSRLAKDHNVFARAREGVENGQKTKLCLREQDHAMIDRNSVEGLQSELEGTHSDSERQRSPRRDTNGLAN